MPWWLALALASGTVALAQDVRPGAARLAPLLPALDTPLIVAGTLPPSARVAVKLDGLPTAISPVWLQLPRQDLAYLYSVMPAAPKVPLTVAAVRSQLVSPLLKGLAFSDPKMGLSVGMTLTGPGAGGAGGARGAAALVERIVGREPTEGRTAESALNAALLDSKPPSAEFERAFKLASGIDFARFKADLDSPGASIIAQQLYDGVTVEHVGLVFAGRVDGTVDSVGGTLVRAWRIANRKPKLPPGDIRVLVRRALAARTELPGTAAGEHLQPDLVLLPYGNAGPQVALRYAWRLELALGANGRQLPLRMWLDAETGQLLKLLPLGGEIAAAAGVWRRDPGALVAGRFEVDPALDGRYVLAWQPMTLRVDLDVDATQGCRQSGNGASPFDSCDLAIPSTPVTANPLANFDQLPTNQVDKALCRDGRFGGNIAFQQAAFLALLDANHRYALALTPMPVFPASPWAPQLESGGCQANDTMQFGSCQGYYGVQCPNYSNGYGDRSNWMNLAGDATVLAHEFGHNVVQALSLQPRCTDAKPATPGVAAAACPAPVGWGRLHDLADGWAADVENTNCIGGWVAKNVGGTDAAKNCSGSYGHSEGSDLPRLLDVPLPFHPASPGDHFPQHREADSGAYGDMQIASTALWQIRQSMRGLLDAGGQAFYASRLAAALQHGGFVGSDPGATDRGIYTELQILEIDLLKEWATSSLPHTSHKVLAGFAKVGVFPIRPICLDAVASTAANEACDGTGAQGGGAAVVEVDDNDPSDDIDALGRPQPERDFIARDGPIPKFHVWTGARYTFDGTASARPLPDTAPCHTQFMLELSSDAVFSTGAALIMPRWITVSNANADAGTPTTSTCYAAWSPSPTQWNAIRSRVSAQQPLTLFYRVATRGPTGRVRRSTQVEGIGPLDPPFAVVNLSGRPW